MKKEIYTLKMFMEDYKGFDWQDGTIILVKKSSGQPFILEGCYRMLIKNNFNKELINWTHNEKIMVITVNA